MEPKEVKRGGEFQEKPVGGEVETSEGKLEGRKVEAKQEMASDLFQRMTASLSALKRGLFRSFTWPASLRREGEEVSIRKVAVRVGPFSWKMSNKKIIEHRMDLLLSGKVEAADAKDLIEEIKNYFSDLLDKDKPAIFSKLVDLAENLAGKPSYFEACGKLIDFLLDESTTQVFLNQGDKTRIDWARTRKERLETFIKEVETLKQTSFAEETSLEDSLNKIIGLVKTIRDDDKKMVQEPLVSLLEAIADNPQKAGKIKNLDLKRCLSLLSNEDKARALKAIAKFSNLESLNLDENNLGEISETEEFKALGSLKSLKVLNLRNNKLTSLPDTIGELRSLKQLYLSENQLTQLPESIGQLSNLERLMVIKNELTSVPSSIGELKELRELTLSKNKLETLDSGVGSCSALEQLKLDGNRLKGLPPEIGRLVNLRDLDVSDNELESIPEEIAELENLQELNLQSNKLTTLPSNFGNLSRLARLYISQNRITELPSSFGKLAKLETLMAFGNALESVPETIGQLESLKVLNLAANNIKTWESVGSHLKKLEEVNIGWNLLKALPEDIENLEKLRKLNCVKNQIETIPMGLGKLSLSELRLAKNQIQEWPQFEGEVMLFKSIRDLDISANKLTRVDESLSRAEQLRNLRLDDNELEKIPDEMSSKSFEVITVGGNKLTALPKWCFRAGDTLNARGNRIRSVPELDEGVRVPRRVNLSSNQIVGQVDFSTYKQTQRLAVGFNPGLIITGIPPEVRHLELFGLDQRPVEPLQDWAQTANEANVPEGAEPYILHMSQESGVSQGMASISERIEATRELFGIEGERVKCGHAKIGTYTTNGGNPYQEDRVVTGSKQFGREFSQQEIQNAVDASLKRLEEETRKFEESGAQFTGAVRCGRQVIRFNVGDSRGIRINSARIEGALQNGEITTGESVSATVDHQLADFDERQRRREAGAKFLMQASSLRMEDVAAPRGFGDTRIKGISHEADIEVINVGEQEDYYLALEACDGVWDSLDNEEVEEIILHCIVAGGRNKKERLKNIQRSLDQAVALIIQRVLSYDLIMENKTDNTTCVYHFADGEAMAKDARTVVVTGVADGHGGEAVAEAVEKRFHEILFEELGKTTFELIHETAESIKSAEDSVLSEKVKKLASLVQEATRNKKLSIKTKRLAQEELLKALTELPHEKAQEVEEVDLRDCFSLLSEKQKSKVREISAKFFEEVRVEISMALANL